MGTCHHSPPTVQFVMVPQQNALTQQTQMGIQKLGAWPSVNPDMWCGQWAGNLATLDS